MGRKKRRKRRQKVRRKCRNKGVPVLSYYFGFRLKMSPPEGRGGIVINYSKTK